MPGMGGITLQEELAKRGIRTPVIFVSAHDSRVATQRVKAGRAAGFLEKPFQAADMERCLERAFGLI